MALEQIYIGIHTAGRGRAKGAGRLTLGGLGWASIVDWMLLQVIGQRFSGVQQFLPFGMGDVAANNDGAGK